MVCPRPTAREGRHRTSMEPGMTGSSTTDGPGWAPPMDGTHPSQPGRPPWPAGTEDQLAAVRPRPATRSDGGVRPREAGTRPSRTAGVSAEPHAPRGCRDGAPSGNGRRGSRRRNQEGDAGGGLIRARKRGPASSCETSRPISRRPDSAKDTCRRSGLDSCRRA